MADRYHSDVSKAVPPQLQSDPAHPRLLTDSAPVKIMNAGAVEPAESETPNREMHRQDSQHLLAPQFVRTVPASVDTPPAVTASSRRSSLRSAAFQHRSAGWIQSDRQTARCESAWTIRPERYPEFRRAASIRPPFPPDRVSRSQSSPDAPADRRGEFLRLCAGLE